LPPSEFIPHAEECGLIIPIGDWVLKQACADLKRWRQSGLSEFRMAINLSALQLAHEQVDGIVHLLAEHDIPGEAFEVEITENVIMKDIDSVVKKLTMLSKHGIQVSIDDFGTGYSSLAYLQKLPINTIKIDRSFVLDMRPDNGQTSIVNAIIAMANGLGMKLIAEGVETEDQLKQLSALGCTRIQGFLVSKPMPSAELLQWLEERNAGSPDKRMPDRAAS
jgi:EAL domain-containing protein (putative c-di-GMP-specific phosphodiesterase class I)